MPESGTRKKRPPIRISVSTIFILSLLIGCSADEPSATELARSEAQSRLVIVGVDALSWDLLDPFLERGETPRFGDLAERSLIGDLRAVEPWISPPNWVSIASGRSPEAHGVVHFFQDRRDIRVPTAWNRLAAAGLRVGLYDQMITWPARDLPGGFMIPDWLRRDDRIAPADAFERAGVEPFVYEVVDLGGREAILQGLHDELTQKSEVFLRLIDAFDPHVAATTFYAVDVANHNLRHALEPDAFEPPIPVADRDVDAFPEILRRLDEAVGKIVDSLRPEDHLLIVSDHGTAAAEPARKWAYDTRLILDVAESEAEIISSYLSAAFALPDEATSRRLTDLLRSVRANGEALFEVWELDGSTQPLAWQAEIMSSRPDHEHFVFAAARSEIAEPLWPDGEIVVDAPPGTSRRRIGDFLDAHDITGDHSEIGFFLAAGPAFAPRPERVELSVIDVASWIYYLADQPIPDDLEGRLEPSWIDVEFLKKRRPRTIAAAKAPRLPEETPSEELGGASEAEIEQRLKALGYVQ